MSTRCKPSSFRATRHFRPLTLCSCPEILAKAATAKKASAKTTAAAAGGRGRKRGAAEITEGDEEGAIITTAEVVEAKIEAKGASYESFPHELHHPLFFFRS